MFRFLIAVIFVFATNTAFSASCIKLAVEKCINLGDPQRCIAEYRAEYCGGSAISESAAPEPEVPDLSPAKSGISLRLEASASDIAAQEQTAAPDVAAPSSETYEQDGKAFTIKEVKKTRFGALKVVQEEDSGTSDVVLDSKSVFPKSSQSNEPTGCYYSIVDLFQMDNTDAALAHESCFGMSRDEYGYFFITIDGDKNTTISDYFPMGGDSAKLVGSQIIIDNVNVVDDSEAVEDNPSTNTDKITVGEDILFRKIVYENGKVTIEKSSVNLQDKTKSCQNLYNVYKQYVEEDCGTNNPYDEVCSVGGMATARGCGDYLDFDTKLAKEAKSACQSRRIMGFAGFKQQICGLEATQKEQKEDLASTHEYEQKLGKAFTSCEAKLSIAIKYSKRYKLFPLKDVSNMIRMMPFYTDAATALIDGVRGVDYYRGNALLMESTPDYFMLRDGNASAYLANFKDNMKFCSSLLKQYSENKNARSKNRTH